MNLEEISSGKRVIAENDGFVVALRFSPIIRSNFVVPKRVFVYLSELMTEREDLAHSAKPHCFRFAVPKAFPIHVLASGPVSAEYAEAKDYHFQ